MVGSHVLDPVVEVDVVLARVDERGGFEERLDLHHTPVERVRRNQAVEAEHAGIAQLPPTAVEQRPGALAVGSIEGKAFEVE